ncbi:MAG: hypothetical protein Q4G33_02075 [bacterium]|nr:hypothetical protein [bacterium]
MKNILQTINKFEKHLDERAERFFFRHPNLAFLFMLVVLPLLVLLAVTVTTFIIAIPVSIIML